MRTPRSERLAPADELIEDRRPRAFVPSLAIEGDGAREVGSLALVEGDGGVTGCMSKGCIVCDK